MRIVLFTSKNHILANAIIKQLFKMQSISIVGIVESDAVYPGKSKRQAILFMLKQSGVRYVASQVVKFLYFQIGSTLYSFWPWRKFGHPLFSYHEIAHKYDIPIFIEKNVHDKMFLKKLVGLKTDLFVSIFFNQIFKSPLLTLAKKDTINLHPAYLPKYRGLSPTFWVLANGEKTGGITVHRIPDASIDAGGILAQVKIPILPSDTEFSYYRRCVRKGIPMLKKVITSYVHNRPLHEKPNDNKAASYFSLPTRADVAQFIKGGRRFLRLSEFLFPGNFP